MPRYKVTLTFHGKDNPEYGKKKIFGINAISLAHAIAEVDKRYTNTTNVELTITDIVNDQEWGRLHLIKFAQDMSENTRTNANDSCP